MFGLLLEAGRKLGEQMCSRQEVNDFEATGPIAVLGPLRTQKDSSELAQSSPPKSGGRARELDAKVGASRPKQAN